MPPRMLVVAGPPGSGKSTLLRPQEQGLAYFNADERARDLNQGSGYNISPAIRAVVSQELERFIVGHIRDGNDFSLRRRCELQLPTIRRAWRRREDSKR